MLSLNLIWPGDVHLAGAHDRPELPGKPTWPLATESAA
jgi:hypothetical protein